MTLFCDTSTGIPRPFVTATQRKILFDSLHSLSHPGVQTTKHLLTTRYVWPKMHNDITHWTKACPQCQQAKVTRHISALIMSFKPPDARFDAVHINIVGPLPPSHDQGYQYLLTCIDRFIRWPEAFPLTDITAESVARAFVHGWIARLGVSSTVITDRGRQFESNLWSQLSQLFGIHRQRTTAYHPAINGMVERFHRQLKSSLKCLSNPHQWIDRLPLMLLGIRSAIKDDLKCTTAELVYGVTLRLPGEFFATPQTPALADQTSHVDRLKDAMNNTQYRPTRQTSQPSTFVHKDLEHCTHVFVGHDASKPPLQPTYDGPFKVLDHKERHFLVELNPKRQDTISIDRLKPAYSAHTPEHSQSTSLHHTPPTYPNQTNQIWTACSPT